MKRGNQGLCLSLGVFLTVFPHEATNLPLQPFISAFLSRERQSNHRERDGERKREREMEREMERDLLNELTQMLRYSVYLKYN